MSKQTTDISSRVFEHGALEIARTYAQAFLNLMAEQNDPEAILSELDEFLADLWNGQPEFASYLSSAFVHADQRDRVLNEILEGRANPLITHLMRVLNRRGRLELLPVVHEVIHRLWSKRMKRVDVQVRSAVLLDEAQQAALTSKIQELLPGQSPVLHLSVEPEMLGGLMIQIGDQLFDASVRANLKVFRERLLAKRYREIRERREFLSASHH